MEGGLAFRPRFAQPVRRHRQVVSLEELHRGGGERFAEYRHAFLPLRIAHDGDLAKVAVVLEVELHVLPQRTGVPSVEVIQDDQQSQLPVLLDLSLDRGHQMLVVIGVQRSAKIYLDDVGRGALRDFNRHGVLGRGHLSYSVKR